MLIQISPLRPAPSFPSVGTVTKASRSHIGLLLHDIINASIPVDNIPQESYEFDEESKLWKNIHSGKKLEEGTVLRFAIHRLVLFSFHLRWLALKSSIRLLENNEMNLF